MKGIESKFQEVQSNWANIYYLSFSLTRETKLQSFQYKIIHRIIACNKWLYNIKIKSSSRCSYCDHEDTIQHFFLFCENPFNFWDQWYNWFKRITGIDIGNSEKTDEYILFGYPGNDDFTLVLNYCILAAKYYIYLNKMCENNNLDLFQYLLQLKHKLSVEKYICIKNNKEADFEKFNIVFMEL